MRASTGGRGIAFLRSYTSKNKGPAGTANLAIETQCGFGVVEGWKAAK